MDSIGIEYLLNASKNHSFSDNMKKSDWTRVLICVGIVWTSFACSSRETASPAKPNILWIVANDLSTDLGSYGNTDVSTPNLDQLAKEGALYENFFTVGAVCSPNRSAFITGMYATSINSQNQFTKNKQPLPGSVIPVTEYFRRAGYFVTSSKGPKMDGGYYSGYNFAHNPGDQYDGQDWRNRADGQPFFAQVHLTYAHRPFEHDLSKPVDANAVSLPPYYPDHPLARKDWALYLETVQLLDQQIGEILERLKKDGLLENTVVFFFSDHGRPHVRDKQFLYDGGIHAPLIVRWPGKLKPETRNDRLISNIDLAPTAMALAGINIPEYMEGRDFLGTASEPRTHILSMRDRCDGTLDRIRAVRTSDFKYIKNFYPERPYTQFNAYKKWAYPMLTLMQVLEKEQKLTPAQKWFMAPTRAPEELYDLTTDPFETINLADRPEYQDKLKEMRTILDSWLTEGDKGQYPEDSAEVVYATELMQKEFKENMEAMGLSTNISDEDFLKYWERELLVSADSSVHAID